MRLGTMTASAPAEAVETIEAGILSGTTIMTLDGEMPVEHLSPGDRIVTRDSGMAVLRRIEAVDCRLGPVRIKAGSLGHTRPDRDMIVAPGTRLHIRDWRAEAIFGAPSATVEALRLVDGEYLAKLPPRDVTVYRLHFDHQHILYADGVELLSAAV